MSVMPFDLFVHTLAQCQAPDCHKAHSHLACMHLCRLEYEHTLSCLYASYRLWQLPFMASHAVYTSHVRFNLRVCTCVYVNVGCEREVGGRERMHDTRKDQALEACSDSRKLPHIGSKTWHELLSQAHARETPGFRAYSLFRAYSVSLKALSKRIHSTERMHSSLKKNAV